MLWMKQNKPEEFDESVMNQVVLDNGSEVGDSAMGLFGEYVEVPFDSDLGKMIKKTEELLEAGTSIICEASFAYEGLFCSVDILKNLGGNKFELYEVKSSSKMKDIYHHDAAFQYYVLTKLGYEVTKVCLVHLNNKYVRHGDLDIQELFTINDITDDARSRYSEVERNLKYFADFLDAADEPELPLGEYCFSPYDCGFFKHCSKGLPTPNVFDVSGMHLDKKLQLYNEGCVSFEELLRNKTVNGNQKLQMRYEVSDLPPLVNKEKIAEFMKQLYYPIYFLDFESFQPPIPLYENSRAYEQIVFQYSLHYIEQDGGELYHKEFLAEPGEDPRRKLAEQLCIDIPKNVCVAAYNMTFEKGRIKELAQLYPDLSEHLMNIHDHIVDLIIPFRRKDYYCKDMQGSYSVKYVLPALFPDDPSLNYKNLEDIHNGGDASAAFSAMQNMPPDELQRCRNNLLKYCGLDTYAMVKIWEKLKEAVK
jgi:hypothetical protein